MLSSVLFQNASAALRILGWNPQPLKQQRWHFLPNSTHPAMTPGNSNLIVSVFDQCPPSGRIANVAFGAAANMLAHRTWTSFSQWNDIFSGVEWKPLSSEQFNGKLHTGCCLLVRYLFQNPDSRTGTERGTNSNIFLLYLVIFHCLPWRRVVNFRSWEEECVIPTNCESKLVSTAVELAEIRLMGNFRRGTRRNLSLFWTVGLHWFRWR